MEQVHRHFTAHTIGRRTQQCQRISALKLTLACKVPQVLWTLSRTHPPERKQLRCAQPRDGGLAPSLEQMERIEPLEIFGFLRADDRVNQGRSPRHGRGGLVDRFEYGCA